ncbi:DUF2306 domain-containing protein [Rudanella paleaurantiibacter]|uniref:DUF2306 domain-containing protein n=1 Tax=Rudanella paleaurantiibacter TaxID=2614655 RepID=A0A7J5U372_9BACT|nr:DUF2306 domain-containing protein [Rudanella paleaurantiibacter]KAB7732247.1 DUF2306 domain-containing protein [Rudanella paleaurantiibacter]
MKTLVSILLITHIIAGSLALLLGLVAMLAQKGSRLHNRAGRVYVWCMTYVALSAVLLFVVQPFTIFRLFLTGVAVFSFYLSTTGYRAVVLKRAGLSLAEPPTFDRWLTYLTLLVSISMICFGVFLITSGAGSFMPILFTFFGVFTLVFALQDLRQFGKPTEKMHWFFGHFTRMGGSYVAALTAFIVNNNARMLPANAPDWAHLAGWIVPSLVGGMLIGRTVAHYKKKFVAKETMVVA